LIASHAAFQRIITSSRLAQGLHEMAGAAVALVAENSIETWALGCGVDASTPMEIGSLTKVFTALLLAEAMRRNELTLATRIDEILLGEPPIGMQPITVGELATHTSGLPRLSFGGSNVLSPDPYCRYTGQDLLAYLRRTQPSSPANPVFSYSNLGYAVLGLLLEKGASQSFACLLEERLLRPIGMTRTALQLAGGADLALGGYNNFGQRASLWHQDAYAPCGAMVSTLDDLALAARNFLDTNSPVAEALALTTAVRAAAPGGDIGLAWLLPKAESAFWHNGATGGYASYFGVNTGAKLAVIVLANQVRPKETTELGTQLMHFIRETSTSFSAEG
jgi:CubicO group peptidase (beta-lactamase class C family)